MQSLIHHPKIHVKQSAPSKNLYHGNLRGPPPQCHLPDEIAGLKRGMMVVVYIHLIRPAISWGKRGIPGWHCTENA